MKTIDTFLIKKFFNPFFNLFINRKVFEKIKQKAKIKTMSRGLSFYAVLNFEINITLLENDKILSEHSQVAKALNDFFLEC